MTIEAYFRSRGLEPLEWDEVLRRAEAKLGAEDSQTFARLHRAFVAYPTEHTARAFYDFVARRGLHPLLASHRFERLRALAEPLSEAVPRGARVLDLGAGGGFLATWLRDTLDTTVSATDLSPVTVETLAKQGFPPPAPEQRFDIILCADSLGEIHADEDDWLSDPENVESEAFALELDARYGFVQKLDALKSRLAVGGAVLLFEPVPLPHFWRGAARLLESAGWMTELRGPEPTWYLQARIA